MASPCPGFSGVDRHPPSHRLPLPGSATRWRVTQKQMTLSLRAVGKNEQPQIRHGKAELSECPCGSEMQVAGGRGLLVTPEGLRRRVGDPGQPQAQPAEEDSCFLFFRNQRST